MKLTQKIMSGMLLTMTLLGCSNNIASNSVAKNEINVSKSNDSEAVYIAKVTENQGASISFKINSPVSGFNTKAITNTNGTPAKTASDVHHYLVYLIKDSGTGAYAGTDPLNSSNIVGGSSFNITNSGATSKTVRFTNIPTVTGAYYVAVRAQDSANNDLIKVNNGSGTAWTGTTAGTPFNGQVAVSSGNGVTVDSSYIVSTNSPNVSINLLDAVGATINSTLTPASGGTPAPVTAVGL